MNRTRNLAHEVAVVVSTYNRPEALNLVLNALSEQTISPAEIHIADDGSDSRTKKVIQLWRDRGLQVKHHWHNDVGFRKTVITNRAIREITLPYVIFLDGDCIPFPRFVEDHVLYRQTGCVLAGGRILSNRQLSTEFEEGST